jgi:hypothetical protein
MQQIIPIITHFLPLTLSDFPCGSGVNRAGNVWPSVRSRLGQFRGKSENDGLSELRMNEFFMSE